MGNSIQINFKKTKAEQDLKEWLLKKRNRSCFVKDLLQEAKDKEKKTFKRLD